MINSKSLMVATALCAGSAGAAAYEVTLFPADANRDGHVSAKEHARYHGMDLDSGRDGMKERQAQLGPTPAGETSYRRADANRDGYVSREEWQSYRQQVEALRNAGGKPAPRLPAGVIVGVPPNESGEATYRQADMNRDGYVSNEEWEEHRRRLEQHYRR